VATEHVLFNNLLDPYPFWHLTRWVHTAPPCTVSRSAQQRHGLSEDLPAIISDRRQNSQTSLHTDCL